MNAIIAPLGLAFLPGLLVQESKDYPADLILSKATHAAAGLTRSFYRMAYYNYCITMPSAVGIEQVADKGFNLIPLLTSDSTDSWNELETTNFIEDTARINPAIGEIEKANITMAYLTRQVNGKEQRIIVLGDADCIGNGELSRQRDGINASNFSVITESFRLLSYDEFPVDTSRKRTSDDKVYLGEKAGVWIKILFMGGLPGILTILSLALWWKRRKK